MHYFGWDPGLKGAIALLGDKLQYRPYPLIKVGDEKVLDLELFGKRVRQLASYDAFGVYEFNQAIIRGAGGARISGPAQYNYGHGNGYMQGWIEALRIKAIGLTPKEWQAELFEGYDIPKEEPAKESVKRIIMEMFPDSTFVVAKSAIHDGCIDATAMAVVAKRIVEKTLRNKKIIELVSGLYE